MVTAFALALARLRDRRILGLLVQTAPDPRRSQLRRMPAAALLALLIGGCAAVPPASPPQPGVRPPATTARQTRARPPHQLPGRARPLALPGLDEVIGASREDLVRLFGAPRLDIVEGDARKLQFSGVPCVLDAYLYPPAPGRPPETTYIDARRSDGSDVDRAACVAALRQR